MVSPVVAEFLGTYVLIAAIAFVGTPLIIVAAFALAVFLAAPISGAHLNPAVTLWALLSGKIGQTKALSYVGAQLLAATAVWGVKKALA